MYLVVDIIVVVEALEVRLAEHRARRSASNSPLRSRKSRVYIGSRRRSDGRWAQRRRIS
jgi:hypothetical protein